MGLCRLNAEGQMYFEGMEPDEEVPRERHAKPRRRVTKNRVDLALSVWGWCIEFGKLPFSKHDWSSIWSRGRTPAASERQWERNKTYLRKYGVPHRLVARETEVLLQMTTESRAWAVDVLARKGQV